MTGRLPINSALAVSVVAVLLAIVAALWQLPGVLAAIAAPGPPAEMRPKEIDQKLAKHEAATTRYTERFAGRSLFYLPTPGIRPKAAAPIPPTVPVVETAPPPPAEYAGPLTPRLIVGDDVWFATTSGDKVVRLRIGEENTGVKLLSTASPWSIRVEWNGREYPIRLFKQFPTPLEDTFETHTPRPSGTMPGMIEAPSEPAASGATTSPTMSAAGVNR